MDKRHERDENLSPRPAAEGVRIIPADEAQAALDAGQAAGRRPEDAPRFGDVPAQPNGPRSPHRFPLPDSVDPATAVPRPPVRPGGRRVGRSLTGRQREPLGTPPPPRVVRLLAPTASPDSTARPASPTSAAPPAPGATSAAPPASGATSAAPPASEPAGRPPTYDVDATMAFPGPDARGPETAQYRGPDDFGGAGRYTLPAPPAPLPTRASDDPQAPEPRRVAGGAHFAAEDGPPAGAQEDAGEGGVYQPAPAPDLAPPQEGITLAAGSGPEMPHWTDPPTGEVPRILPDKEPVPGEELSAWQALGSRGLRWRDEASDWDDLDDVSHLADAEDETRLGALDNTRSEHSDMFSFDEQFERLEDQRSGQQLAVESDYQAPVAAPVGRQAQPATEPAGRGPARRGQPGSPPNGRRPVRRPGGPGDSGPGRGGGRDLPTAVIVGVGLLVAVLVAYAVGPAALMLLATAIVTACALELYNLIQHRGFKPATLLGLCATLAVMFAAYWRGEQALPLVVVLTFVTSMLWYMLGVVEARPVVNVGLTMMAFVWIGVFGSFASLILRAPHGKSILMLPILVTAAADTGAFFVGRAMGSRPLAPAISPGKTWEGAIGGGVAAVIGSIIVGQLFFSKTWSIGHALILGLVIAVVAPLGDLCESMVKRDLHLKDSGTTLPGHGGLLDRFDALLFVLPAAYYLAQYLKLH